MEQALEKVQEAIDLLTEAHATLGEIDSLQTESREHYLLDVLNRVIFDDINRALDLRDKIERKLDDYED